MGNPLMRGCRVFDLAIAGAGPAGSVLALLAVRSGCRVCLIEKSRFETVRIGETAPPDIRPYISRIGLDHLTRAPYSRDAPEVLSVWGSDIPASREHIRSPYGLALHFDRRAFDEALAFAAQDAGAQLKQGCTARFVRRVGGGYDVELSDGERVRSDFAILATGRTGGGCGLPYDRRYLDRNVGVAALFSTTGQKTVETRTVIEAVPGGWFYLAALPDNSIISVFVTMAALVPPRRHVRLRWWLDALARTRVVRKSLEGCRIPARVSVMDARGSHAHTCAGEDWLVIGDARIAPDPLSGQGIVWAIEDAIFAEKTLRS